MHALYFSAAFGIINDDNIKFQRNRLITFALG